MATGKEGSRIAETARLERAQGGQPQAHDSGDPNINRVPTGNDAGNGGAGNGGAAGPHNKRSEINEEATPGTGMLGEPGRASDDDMAPSG